MNPCKAFTGFAAAVALGAMFVAPASAQQITFASATGIGSTVFTYDDATGFAVTPGAQFIANDVLPPIRSDIPALFDFTPDSFANIGTLQSSANGDFTQALSGGSFTLTNITTNELLLSADFTSASLVGTVGQNNGSFRVRLGDVNYTGGVYFTTAGLQNPGEFSFGLTSVTPPFSVTAGNRFADFTAGGSGTFSATAAAPPVVPEPGTVAFLAVNGVGMAGMMFRARRRSKRSMAAAA